MNKRQLTCFLLILVMVPVTSFAQKWKLRRYEACISICTSNYYGDIGGTADLNNLYGFKDIQILHTRPSFAVAARYRLKENMAVRMNLIFGYVMGDDENSRNSDRNFSFTSTIFEPSFQFEYYPVSESKYSSSPATFSHRGMVNDFGRINPYIFAGVGAVISNPKLYRNDVRYDAGLTYGNFGLSIPVGVGFKFGISSKLSLGLELGRRFTTTDFIDGYKSEWSKHNDLYDFGMLTAIYKIPTDRRGLPILTSKRNYRN